jgi:hypothetical protein
MVYLNMLGSNIYKKALGGPKDGYVRVPEKGFNLPHILSVGESKSR